MLLLSIGWNATSALGRRNISHPSPASTYAKPKMSRKKALSASGFLLSMTKCAPLTFNDIGHYLPYDCSSLQYVFKVCLAGPAYELGHCFDALLKPEMCRHSHCIRDKPEEESGTINKGRAYRLSSNALTLSESSRISWR